MGDPARDPDRDLTDLVLEQKNEKGDNVLHVVLSNVKDQKYTLGSKYPGAREREEFVFCRLGAEGLVEPTHCTIRVDEGGNYWIEKASSTAKTFVNLEMVTEPRPLKDGDIISLGIRKNCWCTPGPLFLVDYRLPDSKIYELENREEICINDDEEALGHGIDESPFDNALVLSKILDYLPLDDLKNSRLVCKKWNEEGSKILQKKGQVCFNFDGTYGKPENSTNVHRYLHEMEGLKIRNVNINLSSTELSFAPGEPGEKMLIDLGKLLNSSHNFSSLVLFYSNIDSESSFSILHLILEKLGPKLVELELDGSIQFLPKIIPPLPQMNHLKKLKTHETSIVLGDVECRKWISHLVPLFRNNLEYLTCYFTVNVLTLYLEEFVKQGMPKLETFVVEDDITADTSERIFTLLLQLQTPLTNLKLGFLPKEDNVYRLLEKLIWRNSQSLKYLALDIDNVQIKLPSFPKLKELHFVYVLETTVNWVGEGGLHYNQHFPALRTLNIELYENELFNLAKDGVLNSFFPEGNDFPCETVTQLCIPAPEDPEEDTIAEFTVQKWRAMERSYKKFQERLTKIRKMFPKVEKVEVNDSFALN